jgi:hypothetical protein
VISCMDHCACMGDDDRVIAHLDGGNFHLWRRSLRPLRRFSTFERIVPLVEGNVALWRPFMPYFELI